MIFDSSEKIAIIKGMRMLRSAGYFLSISILTLLCALPVYANDESFEVAGWIPYWRDTEGMQDVKKNINTIDIVFPFAYTVTQAGIPKDQAGLSDRDWKAFKKSVDKKGILFIPTIMWADGHSIHTVLSDPVKRRSHIEKIVALVETSAFDGIDIDYESKQSETIDYFSQFLTELKDALGTKMLTCTVEARTPPDSLYKDVPAHIAYANDYRVIGEVCDRVEIMAYDQQRADIKLNAAKAGEPYFPVADVDWVEKVIVLAMQDIPKEKILLGIPTYGYHYAITVAPNWFKAYDRIGALNIPAILDIAKKNKTTPTRNKAGELSFTYIPKGATYKLPASLSIPKHTQKGNIIAARALAYANKTGKTITINYAAYSDAEAIKQKVELVKRYDLQGIAVFKFDGQEDKKMWSVLK
jgi:spore germination protein YaaH